MMKKICMISFVLHFAAAGSGCASGNDKKAAEAAPAKVYMTRDISPAGMKAVYEALGRKAEGKKVAVKLSTGEPGGNNFLQPALIGDLVKSVKGTIVECNTAYGGGRAKTEDHLKAAADHGFTAIAPVDIMDAEGEVRLPVEGGRHLKYDIVGSHFPEYDFVVVLSHFKGHAMGGFGGAIKNVIAIAAGLSDGLGFGLNARAALVTRGLAETSRLGVALGARASTFMGLSGLGDLMLTCSGDLSRNRQVGLRLGAGESLEDIASSMCMVAEGVKTTQAVHRLAQRLGVDMPVTGTMYSVLYEGFAPREAVQALMGRQLKEE